LTGKLAEEMKRLCKEQASASKAAAVCFTIITKVGIPNANNQEAEDDSNAEVQELVENDEELNLSLRKKKRCFS